MRAVACSSLNALISCGFLPLRSNYCFQRVCYLVSPSSAGNVLGFSRRAVGRWQCVASLTTKSMFSTDMRWHCAVVGEGDRKTRITEQAGRRRRVHQTTT